ncbi:GDP-mannose 4,6-dehydratase, partial [Candidatus Jorgensenbacteria bacterium]|nr:GDP-mannose 4,6-dehydratase [Candidatus Jorgensenbacteria bacterium]
MNILITGGLGFIGSTLAIAEVKRGNRVAVVDALIPDYGGNLFNVREIEKEIEIDIGDVRDKKLIEKLIKNKDVIYSLAGTLSHVDSMTNPLTDLEINCVSQLALLEACRKYNSNAKIIFAGTRNQYGRAKYLPVDENHPMEPVDVNGINNIAAEWYYRLYHNIYGLWTCSLRLTNTFGPRHQMKHPRQGVLNWFIRQILDGKEISLYGTGEQIRDVNYVDDAVRAFILAADSDRANGEVFNLGGEGVSLKKFVKTAIAVMGKGKYEIVSFPAERKAIEIGNYIADWSKIKKILGWRPKVSLKEGIKRTIEYYRKFKNRYW